MSYNDEKPSREPDVPDTTIGGLFSMDFKKHDDLKSMLDSSKDNLKLEAMKRIISLMATGKDMSELFPPVVKNVASKNVELKKLVYVYLVRYAEEQQDLALLSISTFQRALKDPNQLIRGSALRVLSSIRVPVIAPILMLSIKEGVVDMSPFVRKTAAHAIPKLYSLDPEHKECLIEVIEKLLKDKTTLVAGSAVMAFEEVCPDRIDLVHKNFRKLCNLLIDIDEWGQVAVIHMLTRYARTQFLDPNKEEQVTGEQEFYPKSSSSGEDEDKDEDEEQKKKDQKSIYIMDPDHRLLLRNCKPLLQSRNASVVMAVARLYHHCAPAGEVTIVARALVRLLRSHREVQSIVLSNIATMSSGRKGLFEPYLKSFFVHSNDPTHIRLLKLEILTNIAGETSIGTILREFQSYISSSDKQFVASAIQAIGRSASNIPEVTETCLAGLVRLLSNRDEVVVAESVVVIKKLLQLKPKGISDIIEHMAKLLDSITVPMARASILWLLGEYAEKVPKIAPDVLRKAAKTFSTEEDIVKLQILSLGSKLSITNPKQTKALCQYVLNLAKYDQNYDVRDRARFLRQLVLPSEGSGHLHKHIKKIFLASKPPPVIHSVFKDRQGFQLGSLSHMINAKATDYAELPDFPETAPDPSVRNVEVEPVWQSVSSKSKKKNKKKSTFYSESESESDSESGSESSEDGSEESESGTESEEESDSESKSDSTEESDSDGIESESDEQSNSVSESDSLQSTESDSEDEKPVKVTPSKPIKPTNPTKSAKQSKSPSKPASQDQLLIFDDLTDTSSPAPQGDSSILSPALAADLELLSMGNDKPPPLPTVTNSYSQAKSYELLHRMTGNGLGATYRFTRVPCIYSTSMVSVEITFTNTSDQPVEGIQISNKNLGSGLKLQEFQEIASLAPGASLSVSIGINFNDTTQPAKFSISTKSRQYPVSIKAPIGELLRSCTMPAKEFMSTQSKLRGMNESSTSVDIPSSNCTKQNICSRVLEAACVIPVDNLDGDNLYGFSGKTISSGTPVLVTVKVGQNGKGSSVTVNCEKMVISSMLGKEIGAVLQ
ncbi:AP-3 complex subunit beta-2 [Exaiptasia diaphana]|uniref:AP-3 complex subunit beta n=1 Tax=Exaiptasia diaphana TaxID=2652724 RepID=A0A913Y403_EXADI|nr:AP-3 complex subunit beta-2 [Exaiptasia diaphana]KXJ22678.1 AP-3 complex subunit beta-2 [Exaiptasia diaphana]